MSAGLSVLATYLQSYPLPISTCSTGADCELLTVDLSNQRHEYAAFVSLGPCLQP